MDRYYTKPPIGVTPRTIHREVRVLELRRAIREYCNSSLLIPLEWVEEYNCLLKESEEKING